MVCADEVARGKPEPDGYLAAASQLGVASGDCVVVEDAPAGIAAAVAARMRVIAIATTHDSSELSGANALAEAVGALRVRVGGQRPVPRLEITIGEISHSE
jgi:sugar-phosphatase